MMATLSSADIDEVWMQLMSEFSALRTLVPINKNQFRAGLVQIDSELEDAELTIFQNITDSEVRVWLQTNQPLGRLCVERIERKRKEVL